MSDYATAQDAKVLKVEIVISNLLRIGVVLSLAVVVLGVILTFVHHSSEMNSHDALKPLISDSGNFPTDVRGVWAGLLLGQGRSVVILGFLILIATPVMRVAVSILAFIYQRDRVFVVITAVVLILLLLSFFLGKAEG